MGLSKEQILSASDLPREKVSVPEWGGDVFVRVMTGTERDKLISNCDSYRLLSITLCDEEGKRLFTDTDVEALSAKSFKVIDNLVQVALRINKLAPDDREQETKK